MMFGRGRWPFSPSIGVSGFCSLGPNTVPLTEYE